MKYEILTNTFKLNNFKCTKLFPAFILVMLFLMCFTNVKSQTTYEYVYTYDNAGNRTVRLCPSIILNQKTKDTTLTKKDSVLSQNSLLTRNDSISQHLLASDSLSAENNGKIVLSVFPNPTDGLLTLKINGTTQTQDVKILIYNEAGVLLTQSEFNSLEQLIDLTNFSAGKYILNVKIKDLDIKNI